MSAARDEGPVYYREIQKNAYLKRIPNDNPSKLLPLGHKKPPLKPMWTLFCVHNGRTPFLEQYPEAESPSTLAHKPVWRACLRSARHVTASVRPHGTEYDFLVDTDHGPVRMLAPDWESMQDWVSTLRTKLHELKIVPKGENVYCAAPAPPPPRAAARDPTSPLPPTPPVPPDRVPGIELSSPLVRTASSTNAQPTQVQSEDLDPTQVDPTPPTQPEPSETIDISNWEAEDSTPSTSQENKVEPKKSVAKICGQNICLDDSVLKRNLESRTDSDEEFFAEIDRLHNSVENVDFDDASVVDYKQRLVVSDEKESTGAGKGGESEGPSNITVIQVSNKPPHTAIPVVGSDTQIFNFDFKQNVPVTDVQRDSFVNIVHTEVNVQNATDNGYGTVFTKESDYGHISLTTTVSLTGQERDVKLTDVKLTNVKLTNVKLTNVKLTDVKSNEGIYERLCMASTSNENRQSPLTSKKFDKLRNVDRTRKSSLPNLDISSTESTYEYLFPNNNKNTMVTLNNEPQSLVLQREVNSNIAVTSNNVNTSQNHSVRNNSDTEIYTNTSLSNGTRVTNSVVTSNSGTVTNSRDVRPVQVNLSSVSVANVDLNARVIRANVERSHSQNAYDRAPGRETIRTNLSPKREEKSDKCDPPQQKPIWKRGLTELSLLSKLRSLGQRQESPDRRNNQNDRVATSPVKVVHRARAAGRNVADTTRRRSNSLSNGAPTPPAPAAPAPALVPLRARQAAGLRAEQRRGAAVAASLPPYGRQPPVFVDYNRQVWVASWGSAGGRWGGRAGDRVAGVRGARPASAQHARALLAAAHAQPTALLFHRVPLADIYVITKRDLDTIGIKLDGECNITSVVAGSAAARARIPAAGWAVTEVNNVPLNLLKGGEEQMNRISIHGTEVSVLIQPSALVKKIRQALKANKSILSIR